MAQFCSVKIYLQFFIGATNQKKKKKKRVIKKKCIFLWFSGRRVIRGRQSKAPKAFEWRYLRVVGKAEAQGTARATWTCHLLTATGEVTEGPVAQKVGQALSEMLF